MHFFFVILKTYREHLPKKSHKCFGFVMQLRCVYSEIETTLLYVCHILKKLNKL
jgi:hypothetical protein